LKTNKPEHLKEQYLSATIMTVNQDREERLWGPPSLLSNGYQELFPWR